MYGVNDDYAHHTWLLAMNDTSWNTSLTVGHYWIMLAIIGSNKQLLVASFFQFTKLQVSFFVVSPRPWDGISQVTSKIDPGLSHARQAIWLQAATICQKKTSTEIPEEDWGGQMASLLHLSCLMIPVRSASKLVPNLLRTQGWKTFRHKSLTFAMQSLSNIQEWKKAFAMTFYPPSRRGGSPHSIWDHFSLKEKTCILYLLVHLFIHDVHQYI